MTSFEVVSDLPNKTVQLSKKGYEYVSKQLDKRILPQQKAKAFIKLITSFRNLQSCCSLYMFCFVL
ncbi:hypothetical protein C0J52_16031 [Blattella germanica]|nr:hypothetical protein C0J52_16031 [Blattella germanica]